ncbi:double-strand break repair helicase AddA [Thioclava sp. FR2]|uniref:double-strand break repair helicase AddA n=1 Tax=Thioclava sp. FR2 TaxID=3445780 RepID=UPI003EB7545F
MAKVLHDASVAQIVAAKPEVSTWLSANAGSGKTRVLTDRVARLLLNGVLPQHILCLTYTKAAATEMQNRLFKRLGVWAMKPDPELREDLAELGEGSDLTPERLALARQLFARAIETPGGLRIQTIHSFCATLLRRYPLEAGVSPGFAEMDDRTAQALRDEILQDMADRIAPDAVRQMAEQGLGDGFDSLLQSICGQAQSFPPTLRREEALARFDLPPGFSAGDLLAEVFLGHEAAIFAKWIDALAQFGKREASHIPRIRNLNLQAPGIADLEQLERMLLTGSDTKTPSQAKIDKYANKDVRNAMGEMLGPFHDLMGRVEAARPKRLGLVAAEQMLVLHRFARIFLDEYERRKGEQGLLDFDDLIRRAGRLLNDPALAAWVLFRLDGGIDHILVDEAQDTSPQQWEVIERLAAEFTAGAGARSEARTLFVVGDKKQSIYSFQGADLSAFDARHALFGASFSEAGQPMQDQSLDYSFRSARAVLEVVDKTFGNEFPAALGAAPHHLAFFNDLPGRVDLWPLIPKVETTSDNDGWSPVDLLSEDHHTVQLAQKIAGNIRAMIESGTQIIDERHQTRPVKPGDFLILVQRRGPLFAQVIRACKQEGLAIAGADRLKLGEEIAVKDLKALLSFLATQDDDLALASALRSPLLGWSEDQLYRLAHGRKGYLWEALRNSSNDATLNILNDLRGQTDFLRPYELLERILTQHRGRENLLTRLGPEAEDAIDELLTQALIYEQRDVPSLTGFLVWLEADEVEVKRQLGGEGDSIRVMTVHGAKGLEANIVILPDTTDRQANDRDLFVQGEDKVALWKPPGDQRPSEVASVAAQRKLRSREESLRLLYVALTRARTWLIVAGAGDARSSTSKGPKPREEWCWYLQVDQGMQALGSQALSGGGLRHETGNWPDAGQRTSSEKVLPVFPVWYSSVAPEIARDLPPVSPSDLGGAKALPGEGEETEVAKRRGTVLHALLEHLPAHDPATWPEVARAIVPEDMDVALFLAEAAGVLGDPALAFLFDPDSQAEAVVTGPALGRTILGQVDRLVIKPDLVLVVDFKSNRVIPERVDQVPDGILRQMGAYAHVLAQVYPGRRVETAILWTAGPSYMPLDPDIVTAALGRATIP